MMNLTALCPYCEQTIRQPIEPGRRVDCSHCQQMLSSACPDYDRPESGIRCVVCPSSELFVRKDFPQRLGVGIVVTGFVASSFAWYHHQVVLSFAILFATALIDVVLYLLMGNVLECYRCHAQYRGLSSLTGHAGFDLETHEKYRQQAARARQQAATDKLEANTSPSSSATKSG